MKIPWKNPFSMEPMCDVLYTNILSQTVRPERINLEIFGFFFVKIEESGEKLKL